MDSGFEIAILLDIYEKLLTENQQKIMRMRYDEDMSLAEIGEILSVSRQAVRDAICKAETNLHFYESALCIAKKDKTLKNIIASIDKTDANAQIINELIKLTEE